MSPILVIDDQPFARELIVDVLTARGYTCEAAADGSVAWPMLQAKPFSLVISDMVMPVVDGVRLLREIRGDERLRALPVILLTSVLERASIVEAKQLGVRDYLLKSSFSLSDLVGRVERILGPSTRAAPDTTARQTPVAVPTPMPKPANVHLPKLLERDVVIDAIKDVANLRTFASVGAEVARLAALGDAGLADLTRTVRQDPVLAARAMQQAAARGEPAATVEDAVRKLGVAAMKSLAASPALAPASSADGRGLLRCWQHRFAVAHLMERLVPRTDQITSHVAYAAGLLHDVGEILLRQQFADSFRAAQQFAQQAGQPLSAVQGHVLGISPAELSAATLGAIGAPALIVDAIARFWTPTRATTVDAAETLSIALRLASDFATALQFGCSAEARIGPITQAACRAAMLAPVDVNAPEIRAEAMMVLADAVENAPALTPPRDVTIGYVRHSSFAAVDPLATAFGQLAGVRESAALPHASLLATFAALVVVVPHLQTPGLTAADIDHLRRHAGKPALPVLFVTSSANDADGPIGPGMQSLRSPVAMADVAKFVAGC